MYSLHISTPLYVSVSLSYGRCYNKSIITAPSFWGIFVPALIAVFTFFKTEKNKLKWEQYKRKEESYSLLIECIGISMLITLRLRSV